MIKVNFSYIKIRFVNKLSATPKKQYGVSKTISNGGTKYAGI